jgi:hypothetical protein
MISKSMSLLRAFQFASTDFMNIASKVGMKQIHAVMVILAPFAEDHLANPSRLVQKMPNFKLSRPTIDLCLA